MCVFVAGGRGKEGGVGVGERERGRKRERKHFECYCLNKIFPSISVLLPNL